MKYFADCHFHVMTMKEPNFASLINSLYSSKGELISANATDNYIITPKLLKGGNLLNTIENTLQAFSRPIGETFCMMEDDLEGRFSRDGEWQRAPFIADGKLHIKGNVYDKMLMSPLLMDFSEDADGPGRTYYPTRSEDKLSPYIDATIEGMEYYYKTHPDGLFEFYPFVGINPKLHSFGFLKNLLERYVNTSHKMHEEHSVPLKPFYGIKVYPPLDFDPWPEDPELLEKHRYLYGFAEDNQIPIITHCDDQGFRGISACTAWRYTDPASWKTVLENHPNLKLDFAHFGKQYAISSSLDIKGIQSKIKRTKLNPWTETIITMMEEFKGVYSDISFTGASPEFYQTLAIYLSKKENKKTDLIASRLLFGSDFSVNLLKVGSYSEYYSIFDNSPLSGKMSDRISSGNVLDFLGLEEPTPVLSWRERIRALKQP